MKIKKYINLPLLIIGIIIVPALIIFISGYSFSIVTNAPVEVEQNAEFIYHIDVSYNDINSDKVLTPINDTIHVKDVLPEGLTFVKFSSTGSYNTISGNYCSGHVINENYDPDTRTISFDVCNLKDGCVNRVGIIVKAGSTTTRVDHYNTAIITYKGEQYNSLTAHSYVGNVNEEMKQLNYTFAGIPLDKLTIPPTDKQYSAGQEVTLEEPEKVFGYEFIGWSSNDVTITNNKFTMPNNDVTVVGTYQSLNLQKHKLIFKIEGDVPKDFILPKTQEFYETEYVNLGNYFTEDIYNYIYDEKYMFNDYMISNNISLGTRGTVKQFINEVEFNMPNGDATVTLFFTKVPYFITYSFLGAIIPQNAELPAATINNFSNVLSEENYYRFSELKNYNFYELMEVTRGYGSDYTSYNGFYYGMSAHYNGDKVNLVKDYKSTICDNMETGRTVRCRFLGWLYNDEFNMPSHHLNIYGTWMEINGTFEPEIKIEIVNNKDHYEKGDVVQFKTTITNTSDVDIKDLVVENKFNGQNFAQNSNYTVKDNLITIPELKANESVDIYSSYTVGENTNREFTNELEIISAKADDEYYLENSDYSASTNFETRKVGDDNPVNNNPVIDSNETNETNSTIPKESVVPKTLDNAYIYIGLFVLSLVLIVCIVFVLIKNKKNEK